MRASRNVGVRAFSQSRFSFEFVAHTGGSAQRSVSKIALLPDPYQPSFFRLVKKLAGN
jgi:hypothetical protein